jgi:hypothetical protein
MTWCLTTVRKSGYFSRRRNRRVCRASRAASRSWRASCVRSCCFRHSPREAGCKGRTRALVRPWPSREFAERRANARTRCLLAGPRASLSNSRATSPRSSARRRLRTARSFPLRSGPAARRAERVRSNALHHPRASASRYGDCRRTLNASGSQTASASRPATAAAAGGSPGTVLTTWSERMARARAPRTGASSSRRKPAASSSATAVSSGRRTRPSSLGYAAHGLPLRAALAAQKGWWNASMASLPVSG